VQRADIDRFIGALSGQYQQGIFITTAGYTRQAVLKAVVGVPRAATVDGNQVIALSARLICCKYCRLEAVGVLAGVTAPAAPARQRS
jgi:restriction endonuclease Mrr